MAWQAFIFLSPLSGLLDMAADPDQASQPKSLADILAKELDGKLSD